MIYPFSLKAVGLTVGLFLLAVHVLAFLSPKSIQTALRHFPRDKTVGTILLAIVVIWSFILTKTIDLGEFTSMRTAMLIAIPIAAILIWQFVDEFLAVRALGMLALLAAEPLLECAFLKPPETRLLLVVLAYAWIVAGLFWVGMPYLLRDQIRWVTASASRWNIAVTSGVLYGVALVVCSVFFY